MKILLKTVNEEVYYPFTIIVTSNTAPHFILPPPSNIKIPYNQNLIIDLANTYVDDESNVISLNCFFTQQPGVTKIPIINGIF